MKNCLKCNTLFEYGSRKDSRTRWCIDCKRAADRKYKNERYVRKTVGTSQERSGVLHTFFDSWTSDSAYALGLIFTDGCIQKHSSWAVTFSNTEKYLVEWLHKTWKSNRKITEIVKATKDHTGYLNCFVSGVTSTAIGEKLVSLGVTPRKSKTHCNLPLVPKEFYLDYIRGLIDGDGSVSLCKNKGCVGGKTLQIVFVNAWESVCLSFQKILAELGIHSKFFPRKNRKKGKRKKEFSSTRVASVLMTGEQAENLCKMLYASEKICHLKKRGNWETYFTMRMAYGGLISSGEYIQKKRTTPNYPWLTLLGTMTDRELAKIASMSFSRIGQLRADRNIPTYKDSMRASI